MKIIIQILLWVAIVFLGYQLWNSISEPEKFNKERDVRYKKVIKNLKDIQKAQLAHQEIKGDFSGDFKSLVNFVETAKFAITTRRDTAFADVAKNKAYGLDPQNGGYILEEVIVDTIAFKSVKDSLFKNNSHRTMMNIPIEGVDKKIEMKAGKIVKNDVSYAVFEAKVAKRDILENLNKPDLLAQELQEVSVEGIKGSEIRVGSMTDVNTSGNWSKLYDSKN